MTEFPKLPAPLEGCAFFLDVDGTLVDLAETPERIVVPPDLPEILSTLAKRSGGAVALVSGRPIAALDRIAAPVRLASAGVHGAEMRFADGATLIEAAGDLDDVRHGLATFAAENPALLVEDKGAAIAVHYRAAPSLGAEVERALRALIAGKKKLTLQPGKMIFEVRTAAADKGRALTRFMQRAPFAGRTPVAIGDDLTDEHMFEAARAMGGLGVRVAQDRGKTAASVSLESPAAVRAWLQSLLRARD